MKFYTHPTVLMAITMLVIIMAGLKTMQTNFENVWESKLNSLQHIQPKKVEPKKEQKKDCVALRWEGIHCK